MHYSFGVLYLEGLIHGGAYLQNFAVTKTKILGILTYIGTLTLTLSEKMPTYPSPKPTLSLNSHLGKNGGLGEG